MEIMIVLIFLIMGCIWDIRKKSIPREYIYSFGAIVFLYLILVSVVGKNISIWKNALFGIIPGIVSLILSRVTKEQIGFGDGWVIIWVGMLVGIDVCLSTLFAAFMVLTFVSVILLVIKRAGRKTTVPFLPFLLIGCIIQGVL